MGYVSLPEGTFILSYLTSFKTIGTPKPNCEERKTWLSPGSGEGSSKNKETCDEKNDMISDTMGNI